MLSLAQPLSDNNVSMKRFESRPNKKDSKRLWEYYFYLDIDGHVDDPPVASALEEIKSRAGFFKKFRFLSKVRETWFTIRSNSLNFLH